MSGNEYGPDFVPSPAQSARADQNLAAARNSVEALNGKVRRGELDPVHAPAIAVGLLAADEADRLAGPSDDPLSPALAMVATAVLQLAEAENRGYRRAVQALRDVQEETWFNAPSGVLMLHPGQLRCAATYLETLAAAAPRNEGAQT